MILRPNGALEAAPVKLLSHGGGPYPRVSVWGQGFWSSPLICFAAHPYPHGTVSGLLIHDRMAFMTRGLSEYKLCP